MAQVNILISGKATSQSKLDKSAGNGGVAALAENEDSPVSGTKSSILQSVAVHMLIGNGINMTKNIINDSVSLYGDLTGNYREQTSIENSFKIASGLSGIGTSIAAGAATGGLAGGIATGVIAVGNQAYSSIRSIRQYNISNVKANIQANFNSQRIGNILVGGGRL